MVVGARRVGWIQIVWVLLFASVGVLDAQTANDPDSTAHRLDQLRQTEASIRALLNGSLPDDFVVQRLFEVDLLDESSVEARRKELQRAMTQRKSERATADSMRVAELDLANRVDQLRLQFLLQSAEERARFNQAESQRRQLLRETQAATQAQRDAEERAEEAELERERALADAGQQKSALLEDIARERAQLQTARATLARLAVDLAKERAVYAEHSRATLDGVLQLDQRLQGVVRSDRDLEPILRTTLERLRSAHGRLQGALQARRTGLSLPNLTRDQSLRDEGDSTVARRLGAIETLYASIQKERDELHNQARDLRWHTVRGEADHVRLLNDLRIRCLEKLSESRRRQILGFGRDGIEQLRLEVRQLGLMLRTYIASRVHHIDRLPSFLGDFFQLGSAFFILLRVAIVLSAGVFVRRRWESITGALQASMLRRPRDARESRRIRSIVGFVRSVAPWALVLLAIAALRWSLKEAAHSTEVSVLLLLATWYTVYRLIVSVLYAFVVKVAVHYFTSLGPAVTVKLLRSLRRLVGVLIWIAVLLDLSRRLVGSGFLHHVIVQLAWIAVLLTVLAILHGWRDGITNSYLNLAPAGRLANAVRRTREKRFGFFVGIVAFAWLAGRAALIVGRDFVLGFDEVRRALAFLFRRRMEKHAERTGYSTGDLSVLPPLLVQSFTEEPVESGEIVIDHFPGLDRFHEALAHWRSTRTRGSFLLIGERGIGKTSWLQQTRAPEGMRVDHYQLDDRVWTRESLTAELGKRLLDDGAAPTSIEDLADALLEGDERLIVLDMCQNMFLGTVGGYTALEAFSELMNRTRARVFWMCACNSHAWTHLEAVRSDLALFRQRQALDAWTEEELSTLIEKRMAASGVEADYKDLLLDRVDATNRSRLLSAEEGYIRLLWDFSDGNPRAAMHFWLRSLDADTPDRVRVHLFRTPPIEVLEQSAEQGLFVLRSVIVHENLTVDEAAASTRYPRAICRLHLDRLAEADVLQCDSRRYRVTTHWHRTVVRFLRRKNLLVD